METSKYSRDSKGHPMIVDLGKLRGSSEYPWLRWSTEDFPGRIEPHLEVSRWKTRNGTWLHSRIRNFPLANKTTSVLGRSKFPKSFKSPRLHGCSIMSQTKYQGLRYIRTHFGYIFTRQPTVFTFSTSHDCPARATKETIWITNLRPPPALYYCYMLPKWRTSEVIT